MPTLADLLKGGLLGSQEQLPSDSTRLTLAGLLGGAKGTVNTFAPNGYLAQMVNDPQGTRNQLSGLLSGELFRNENMQPLDQRQIQDLAMNFAPMGIGMVKSANLPYQIAHKPMTVDGGAATLDDLTKAFGDDIYGPNALQYFGSGDTREKAILGILNKVRGNPNATVKIYRGVPSGVDKINPGDWVTLSPKIAADYGKVVSMEVPASHITGWSDSLMEYGYHPK